MELPRALNCATALKHQACPESEVRDRLISKPLRGTEIPEPLNKSLQEVEHICLKCQVYEPMESEE